MAKYIFTDILDLDNLILEYIPNIFVLLVNKISLEIIYNNPKYIKIKNFYKKPKIRKINNWDIYIKYFLSTIKNKFDFQTKKFVLGYLTSKYNLTEYYNLGFDFLVNSKYTKLDFLEYYYNNYSKLIPNFNIYNQSITNLVWLNKKQNIKLDFEKIFCQIWPHKNYNLVEYILNNFGFNSGQLISYFNQIPKFGYEKIKYLIYQKIKNILDYPDTNYIKYILFCSGNSDSQFLVDNPVYIKPAIYMASETKNLNLIKLILDNYQLDISLIEYIFRSCGKKIKKYIINKLDLSDIWAYISYFENFGFFGVFELFSEKYLEYIQITSGLNFDFDILYRASAPILEYISNPDFLNNISENFNKINIYFVNNQVLGWLLNKNIININQILNKITNQDNYLNKFTIIKFLKLLVDYAEKNNSWDLIINYIPAKKLFKYSRQISLELARKIYKKYPIQKIDSNIQIWLK